MKARLQLLILSLRSGGQHLTEALLRSAVYVPTWPISPALGRKIIKRDFTFCGQSVEMPDKILWYIEAAGVDWHREFFSYKWLQDVAAIQSDKIASSFAREFINAFTLIKREDEVHRCAWEAEVVGERLTHWLYYRHFVLKGGSPTFYARYQRSLLRHVQLIYERLSEAPETLGPNALKGMIASATILPPLGFMLEDAIAALVALMKRDVLADGGHISQSPNYHLSFLKTLIEIRDMLEASEKTCEALNYTISGMGAWLHFLCHGDGRLALFQDNMMEDALILARAVELSGAATPLGSIAPESGYGALRKARTCVMIRLRGIEGRAVPLGIAACEISEEEERIIVNCGTYTGSSAGWKEAMRQPSAFSKVCLMGKDTLDVMDTVSFTPVQNVGEEESRAVARVGYALSEHIHHQRHVELNTEGNHIKGKDSITLAEGAAPSAVPPIVARFHLHPDVRCQPQKEGGIMLTLVSGRQWMFSCTYPRQVTISESVYLGYHGKPQKTLQIVVAIPIQKTVNSLGWELKKVG